MALTTFIDGDDAVASQVTQFYSLLTGVMTDQAVTLKNTLTLGGSQATNAHLLALVGVASQTGDFLRVTPSGAGSPTVQVNSAGKIVTATLGPATAQQHTLPAVASDTFALLAASQTLTGKTLTTPTIGDFTSAQHTHASAAQGGTLSGIGEIDSLATGTIGVGDFTSTTTATVPSCSKLLSCVVNGLEIAATRTNATTIAYNQTRVSGDAVRIHYVAT